MTNVLVVVDMQPFFKAAAEPHLRKAVMDLVDAFRERNDPIIALLGCDCGSVPGPDPVIIDTIGGYDRGFVRVKRKDNGGPEVNETIMQSMNICEVPDGIYVCGVNLCHCVKETAIDLADRLVSQVHVIVDACGSNETADKDQEAIAEMLASHVAIV